MENGPLRDDFPIRTSIYSGFSMAMLNNQMVYVSILFTVSSFRLRRSPSKEQEEFWPFKKRRSPIFGHPHVQRFVHVCKDSGIWKYLCFFLAVLDFYTFSWWPWQVSNFSVRGHGQISPCRILQNCGTIWMLIHASERPTYSGSFRNVLVT